MGDSSSVKIIGGGKILIKTCEKQGIRAIFKRCAACSLTMNQSYVTRLNEKGATVIFGENYCEIKSNGETVATGRNNGKLFQLNEKEIYSLLTI